MSQQQQQQQQQPSLQPYLRARNADPSLIPNTPLRSTRTQTHTPPEHEFLEFLHKLSRWVILPVTVPLRVIQTTLTSPLTLSVVLKLALLAFLTLASAVFSIIAVGAFWWSWRTGGTVEVEGWLVYGSRTHRTPHTTILLPQSDFYEDLKYDVEVEMELVRPSRGSEEMGNFMISLDLRSSKNSEVTLIHASQPSLPPPPLLSSYFYLPDLLPPCLIPYPFRSLCPSNLLGYASSKPRTHPQGKGAFSSPAKGKDVVLLKKGLMDGVMIRPTRGDGVGSCFVSVGREDSFVDEREGACKGLKEVRTTGWVVVRFLPKPTGIRWLLTSHPLPPLLLLPPISLSLTFTSSLLAFFLITYLRRTPQKRSRRSSGSGSGKKGGSTMSEEALLAEKRARTFDRQDREERREAERRREEWEEVEGSVLGARIPDSVKRSRIESTVGGSETTAPTAMSFAPIPESDDGYTESTFTEAEITPGGTPGGTPRLQPLTRSGAMTPIRVEDEDEWEDAQ